MNIKKLYENGMAFVKRKTEPFTAEYRLREKQNIATILSTRIDGRREVLDPREFKKGMLIERVDSTYGRCSLSIVSDNYPCGGFMRAGYLCRAYEREDGLNTDRFPDKIGVEIKYFQISQRELHTFGDSGVEYILSHPNVNSNGGVVAPSDTLAMRPSIVPFSKKEIAAVLQLVYDK